MQPASDLAAADSESSDGIPVCHTATVTVTQAVGSRTSVTVIHCEPEWQVPSLSLFNQLGCSALSLRLDRDSLRGLLPARARRPGRPNHQTALLKSQERQAYSGCLVESTATPASCWGGRTHD